MLQKLIYLTSNSNINTTDELQKLVQANTNYIDLSFDQQTRELNQYSKDVTQTQQQRPELPTVTHLAKKKSNMQVN